MIPSNNRIPRKLFKPLLNSKKYANSRNFSLRSVVSDKGVRISVSVSKKISKKAVIRNKIRRRTYSAMRDIIPNLSPGFFLLSALPGSEKIKGESLKLELAELFKKR